MRFWIDLLLVLIIIICAWSGYKKGMIMGIGGVLAIIISLYGANLLSNTFSYEVIPALRPFASGYMAKLITEEVNVDLGITGTGLSVDDYLAVYPSDTHEFCYRSFKAIGLADGTADSMAAMAMEYAEEQSTDIKTAVTEVLCREVAYAAGFILFFLILIILLTIIGNLPNLSFKIPNMDLLNDISGAALGVITGAMFCIVLVWALKFTGLFISQDTIDETLLASWFMKHNFLSNYVGL